MNQKEPIQILVTLDQNYRHILTVMLYSLACTNPQEHFIVRIMHPAKEEWSMEGMRRLLPGGQREQFTFRECAVLEEELSGAPISARWPEVMYYRLFAPWVIPECPERMLYLDPDIVVLNRVRPLWDMDLCGSWFAGASHVQRTYHEHLQDPMQVINDVRLGTFGGTYLNSGVLLMDMKQIRENSSAKEILDFIHRHRAHLRLPDQDVLNMLYKDHLTAVDPFIYNLSDRILNLRNQDILKEKITDEWIRANTVFVHYCTRNKPWKKNYIGKLEVYWYEYEGRLEEER